MTLHSPSSNCCTKWGPHPHHLSPPCLSFLRNSSKRWATSSGWGLKQSLIGRIQLKQISGTQWAEWGCWENRVMYLQGPSLSSLKSHARQLEKDSRCTYLQYKAKGQSKVVDRRISMWVKVGQIIRHTG